MSTKEVLFNSSTGEVFVERSDGSTQKFNIADTVTAVTGQSGLVGITQIVSLTQAQYDAIVTKDAATLYVIVEG